MTRQPWLACLCILGAVACSSKGDDFQPIQPTPVDASTTPHDGATTPHDTQVIANAADLSILITGAPDPVAANATLTYAINVVNFGSLDASKLTVTQNLPGGNVAFVSATGIGWQCANAGQVVTCTRDTLLVGEAPTISVVVTTPETGGTLTSTATVASLTADSDNTNNTATTMTTVLTPADLSIAITDAPDPVAAGGNVTYTITVHDQGPGDSSAVSVVDHLPIGATFVSASGTGWSCSAAQQDVTCLLATLAASASSTITLVATAPGSGGTLTNAVSVSAMTPDGSQLDNTASTSTTINAAADLAVAIVDTPHPVLASGTLSYAVNVTNNGPNTASGVTITDGLPAGNVTFLNATGSGWSCSQAGQVVTCNRPSLLVGAAPTLTITVQAPSEATSLVDTATVTSTSSDLVTGNNTGSVTTPVLSAADLSVDVEDSVDPVTTGGALTYTVAVNNAGPSQANNVSVVSQLPSGVTFQSASGINWTCSAVGQQVTCTTPMLPLGTAPAISIATTAPTTDGAITETSTVSTATTNPVPGNNAGSQDTTVNAPSDLALTLSASPTAAPASSTLTYTIGVTNLGPRDATNLVVTNRLPDGNVQFQSATGIGWACALAGQIVTCTRPTLLVGAAPSISIQITTPPTNGGLVDQAAVTASTADLNTANNSATVSDNVFDSADLSITTDETPNPVRIGTNFAYTLSIANDGPTPATAVEVDDTLPSGATFVSASGPGWTCSNSGNDVTCTLASLNPNSSASAITIVATAPATAQTMSNTATVSSATSDPDSSNNTATTSTLANLFADLSVTLTDTPDPVQGTTSTGCSNNDCVTYTIPVANAGPDTATGVKVVIQLPGNGTFFNAVGSGWVCPAPTTTITCTRAASLASGATAPNITLVWKAPSPGGFSIVVAPTVSGTSTNPNTANNTATEDTTVRP